MHKLPEAVSDPAPPGTVEALRGDPLSRLASDSVVFLINRELVANGSVKSLLTKCDPPALGSRNMLCGPSCRAALDPTLPSSYIFISIYVLR